MNFIEFTWKQNVQDGKQLHPIRLKFIYFFRRKSINKHGKVRKAFFSSPPFECLQSFLRRNFRPIDRYCLFNWDCRRINFPWILCVNIRLSTTTESVEIFRLIFIWRSRENHLEKDLHLQMINHRQRLRIRINSIKLSIKWICMNSFLFRNNWRTSLRLDIQIQNKFIRLIQTGKLRAVSSFAFRRFLV